MSTTQTTSRQSQVKVKLFCGCVITSEVRMHLNFSIQWKHALIMKEEKPLPLCEINFRGTSYLGMYLESDKNTLTELRVVEDNIKQYLNFFCPDLNTDNVNAFLFPQVLIA